MTHLAPSSSRPAWASSHDSQRGPKREAGKLQCTTTFYISVLYSPLSHRPKKSHMASPESHSLSPGSILHKITIWRKLPDPSSNLPGPRAEGAGEPPELFLPPQRGPSAHSKSCPRARFPAQQTPGTGHCPHPRQRIKTACCT